jgi:hypothetical protein
MTCGCAPPDSPNNDHGDSKNLTLERFKSATRTKAAGGISVQRTLSNARRAHRKRK